jgi:protein-disulfide isomerase
MTKMHLLTSAALSAALLVGCQKDPGDVDRKLDDINKKLDALTTQMGAVQQGMGRIGTGGGQQQQPQRRPEPDPSDVYAVPVDGDPFIGAPDALVTIVKGSDYACPYCEKVRATEDQLLKDYDGKIRIVYKQFVVHPQVATLPAQAACAATKQGHFKEMSNLIWDKGFSAHKFDQDTLTSFATEIHQADPKFDVDKWKADMAGDCTAFIQKDQAELAAVGQGATPTFYINGRYMSGAQPLPAFKAIIDEELKKAQDRVSQGTPAADYYKTWVLDKGLKKFVPKQAQPQAAAPNGQQPQVIQVKPTPVAPPAGAPGGAVIGGAKPAEAPHP